MVERDDSFKATPCGNIILARVIQRGKESEHCGFGWLIAEFDVMFRGIVQLAKPATDGRRWIGVEAATAEAIGTDTLLGRPVTKYRVRGTIFDNQIPFEGDVWTTAENIVLKVEGTGRVDGFNSPIKVTPVQLTVVPVASGLLTVPSTFARARKSEGGYHPED